MNGQPDRDGASGRDQDMGTEYAKLVSDLATAELTGKLGLATRRQACEKIRHEITLDNQRMTPRMEVIDLQSVTEF